MLANRHSKQIKMGKVEFEYIWQYNLIFLIIESAIFGYKAIIIWNHTFSKSKGKYFFILLLNWTFWYVIYKTYFLMSDLGCKFIIYYGGRKDAYFTVSISVCINQIIHLLPKVKLRSLFTFIRITTCSLFQLYVV